MYDPESVKKNEQREGERCGGGYAIEMAKSHTLPLKRSDAFSFY